MQIHEYKIGFLGLGHMGELICHKLLLNKMLEPSQVVFCRRSEAKAASAEKKLGIASHPFKGVIDQSDLLFLAVRPSDLPSIEKELLAPRKEGKTILSLLAGVHLPFLEEKFPHFGWIRAMPNLAIESGEGVTFLTSSGKGRKEHIQLARLLFQSLGMVREIEDRQMDIATGLGGSGIAFALKLIEEMALVGVREGLSHKMAFEAAAQVFIGAGKMALRSEIGPLLEAIATPGGTTEAGLNALPRVGLGGAILAASERARMILS